MKENSPAGQEYRWSQSPLLWVSAQKSGALRLHGYNT